MKAAKDLIEKRLEYKEILIAHDVARYRDFIEKNKGFVDEVVVDQVLAYDDEKMSELMHVIKAASPYLGQAFKDSRNVFRLKALEADEHRHNNTELKAFMVANKMIPRCALCQYFRNEAAEGYDVPCSQMVPQPAMPEDYACAGWTALDERKIIKH